MSSVAVTDQNQLRPQHYVFAHYFLREESFEATAYCTLENGFENNARPRTVFCEWTVAGSHLNHGDGPPATVEDFGERILRHINGELLNDQ